MRLGALIDLDGNGEISQDEKDYLRDLIETGQLKDISFLRDVRVGVVCLFRSAMVPAAVLLHYTWKLGFFSVVWTSPSAAFAAVFGTSSRDSKRLTVCPICCDCARPAPYRSEMVRRSRRH